jgi:hypothetical protein
MRHKKAKRITSLQFINREIEIGVLMAPTSFSFAFSNKSSKPVADPEII